MQLFDIYMYVPQIIWHVFLILSKFDVSLPLLLMCMYVCVCMYVCMYVCLYMCNTFV